MVLYLQIFTKIGYGKINREVCIHPSVRQKPFCSQVDMTKVSLISSISTESQYCNIHFVQVHVIKRDEQDLRVQGDVLSFYKINCYLPITIVEDCLERMKQ